MSRTSGKLPAISDAHLRLGQSLRQSRLAAGLTTRQIPKDNDGAYYSSGHISLIESGRTAPSPELVDAYARLGDNYAELRSLHQQVMTATQAAGRRRREGEKPEPETPPRDLAAVTDRRDVQRHYIVVSNSAHYSFTAAGAIRDVVCTIRLRARTPAVRIYYTGFSYPTDQRLGVLSIEAISGGQVTTTQESHTGALSAYFTLDRDLAPDDAEPFTMMFRVKVHSDARAAPRLRFFADTGSEQLRLSADFDASMTPLLTWWFEAADVIDAEHLVPGHELTPTVDGAIDRTFDRLVPSWCYGFAWIW